ncbi:MAG: hypothetical protein JWL76_2378 [Thermoleophilia bacterium]|nr:hypothetical protein [Thermoleophilia bacterium]
MAQVIAAAAATLYNLRLAGFDAARMPPMTDPVTQLPVSPDAPLAGDAEAIAADTNVGSELRSRVVREARRETWFVVNEGIDDLATIPIDLRQDASLRRVEVNGEVSEFSAGEEQVLVRPRRILRAGAGTIVVLHFR